jgi:hypothetical protein
MTATLALILPLAWLWLGTLRVSTKSAVLCALLVCCGPRKPGERFKPFCATSEERTDLVACLTDVTKAGNPMSDEEGEDLVYAAGSVCQASVCPVRRLLCNDYYQDCRLAEPIKEVKP